MKIAMVSEHASPLAALGGVDSGGQNVHVAALAQTLAHRGHHVTVYTRRDDADLPERVNIDPGVEVVHVKAGPAQPVPKDDLLPHMAELAQGIEADAAQSPPDIIHSHFWMSGLAAQAAAESLDVPTVHTFHALGVVKRRNQGTQDTSPMQRIWLEPHVGRQADGIIATCSDEAFELKALGVPSKKISIIPCGVDLNAFTPAGPIKPRSGHKRIISIGRLVPRKGFTMIIDALARMSDPRVELLIIGGPGGGAQTQADPEGRRLLAYAQVRGLKDRVHLTGQVSREELPSFIRSADVVACTPWYEPFGIVPLEAMACGVPVVASAVGGLTDTVVEGVTGRLVPPQDSRRLAEVLNQMLGSPRHLNRYGRKGRKRVESRYSWDGIAARTEKTYRRILATRTLGAQAGVGG